MHIPIFTVRAFHDYLLTMKGGGEVKGNFDYIFKSILIRSYLLILSKFSLFINGMKKFHNAANMAN